MTNRDVLTIVLLLSGTVFAAPETAGAGTRAVVTVTGDRLSATVRDASPRELLNALATTAGLRITVGAGVPDAVVTATLSGVPVEHGVARLLGGASYALVYDDSGALREIHVIAWPGDVAPARATATLRLELPPVEPAVTASALQADALSARAPEERARALQALAYLGDARLAAPALAHALDDRDITVRGQALALIKDTADGVPVDALARMARTDRSPGLRAAALALLAERTEAAAIAELRLGLGDPAREVRERAQELLDDLRLSNPPHQARHKPANKETRR